MVPYEIQLTRLNNFTLQPKGRVHLFDHFKLLIGLVREAASFFSGLTTKRGEGVKGWTTKKKEIFLKLENKKNRKKVTIKLEGGCPLNKTSRTLTS